jgi:hypothetical protein
LFSLSLSLSLSLSSDDSGEYTLAALLGTRVYPEVDHAEHAFESTVSGNQARYNRGIPVSFKAFHNRELSGHDFYDTTTGILNVTIAGGGKYSRTLPVPGLLVQHHNSSAPPCNDKVCDIPLGTSKVEVTLEGCDRDAYHQEFVQSGVRGLHEVPAHKVKAKVVALSSLLGSTDTTADRQHVMLKFGSNMVLGVDLTNIKELENGTKAADNSTNAFAGGVAAGNNDDADTEAIADTASNVRFQYNGVMNIRPVIKGGLDRAGDCHAYEQVGSNVQKTRSFHGELLIYSHRARALVLILSHPSPYCVFLSS